MAMVEVGYELRDSVCYLIACEEVEPIDSWPYDRIFTELVDHPELTPLQLGQLTVRKYIVDYKEQGRFVTQSVCDLARSDGLADAITLLGVELEGALKDQDLRTRIMAARAMAQSYYIKDYVDIYDFCDILFSLLDDPAKDIRRACEAVKKAIGNTRRAVDWSESFVQVHGFYGFPLKSSHGASIYFPCRDFSPLYGQLDFAKRIGWSKFIRRYAELAGRPARADFLPENADLVGAVHLGGHPGDGELGPGDPILIPDDPLCLHTARHAGRRSRGPDGRPCPGEIKGDEIALEPVRASAKS
jgi:cysteine peptidase C11 family protein